MSSLPTLSRTDGTPKTFWERPEGVTGMITMGALALGGFFAAKLLLPSILEVLTLAIAAVGKVLVLGALGVAALAFFMIATNPKVHALIGYGFKLVMRKLTGAIIEIDPIGIMRIYIDDLKKRLATMDVRLRSLSGQIAIIKNAIEANNRKQDEAMKTAAQAQKQGMKAQMSLNARKAGRAGKVNLRFEDLLKKMQFLHTMLLRYREASDVMVQDMSDEVDSRELERKATLNAYSAMQGARDILAGSGDKREMYDQAMEFAVNDYGMKIGEIEHFMTTSQSFIDGLDLENGVFDEEAMEKIQQWEQKADSLMLGSAKQEVAQNLGMPSLTSAPASSYVKLLSK